MLSLTVILKRYFELKFSLNPRKNVMICTRLWYYSHWTVWKQTNADLLCMCQYRVLVHAVWHHVTIERLRNRLNVLRNLNQILRNISMGEEGRSTVGSYPKNLTLLFSESEHLDTFVTDECEKRSIEHETVSKESIVLKDQTEPDVEFPHSLKFNIKVKS